MIITLFKISGAGVFQCRFEPQSLMMKQFGELLRQHKTASHTPYFVIQEQHRERQARQVILEPDVIETMILRGRFHLDSPEIKVSNVHSTTKISFCLGEAGKFWPISGFPRKLHLPDTPTSKPKFTLHNVLVGLRLGYPQVFAVGLEANLATLTVLQAKFTANANGLPSHLL